DKLGVAGDNYLFYPEIEDRAVAERLMDTEMIQLLKRGNFPPEYIYAWHKCGFFHPNIVDSICKAIGWPTGPSRLSKKEIRQWNEAVKEYREKGGEIPGY
ncbi:unnamed protein product, partial [marine sediment metagenome]